MKEELKKYIKKNLELENKSYEKHSKSHEGHTPFAGGLLFKKIVPLFDDDEIFEDICESADSVHRTHDEKCDAYDTTLSIEDNVIPFFKENGVDISSDNEIDDIPPFLKKVEFSTLDDFIDKNKKYSNFQTMLFQMIDERHLTDADVYNKVHIDRRLFSKIRNDINYHPSKETVILLGLSLKLNEEEIERLLDSASYSLPRNNHYDLIIRFCFMKGIYEIADVDELLDQYNCKLFNY